MKRTVRFFTETLTVYVLTIGAIGYAIYPAPIFSRLSPTVQAKSSELQIAVEQIPQSKVNLVSGKPVRVTVPDYAIDLPVDDGYYNESNGSWTLSDTHAQYAMMTTLANNISGNTLVYGHGTDAVFGKLGANTPAVGTAAYIYTNNGHVFMYKFIDARSLTPNDVSVLTEQNSPATLTLQTCTGVFSEWRTMFRFQFVGIAE